MEDEQKKIDKLTVRGLGHLDGTYEYDIVELIKIGEPGCLTNREGHRVKVLSGVRLGELYEAFFAYDNDVMIALAIVVLERLGKEVDDDALWDAPMGAGIEWDIAKREDDADSPPEQETPAAA